MDCETGQWIMRLPHFLIPFSSMSVILSQLKDHLSVHYPSRPACTDQRLIYSGHLMRDEQTLHQVFSSSSVNEESGNGTVTLHLVCSNSATSNCSPPAASGSSRQSPASSSSGSANPVTSQPATTTTTAAAAAPGAGTLPLLFPQMPASLLTHSLQSPAAQQPLVWTPEQLALAQQMYQQFMSQLQSNPNSRLPLSLTVPSLLTAATSSTAATNSPLILNPAAVTLAPPLNQNIVQQQQPVIHNNNNIPAAQVQPAAAAAPIRQDDDDDDDPDIIEDRVCSLLSYSRMISHNYLFSGLFGLVLLDVPCSRPLFRRVLLLITGPTYCRHYVCHTHVDLSGRTYCPTSWG